MTLAFVTFQLLMVFVDLILERIAASSIEETYYSSWKVYNTISISGNFLLFKINAHVKLIVAN